MLGGKYLHRYSILNIFHHIVNEPKRAAFEYAALNANELVLPEKRAELQQTKAMDSHCLYATFVFTITGWLFSHTAATQRHSNTLYVFM